MCIEGIQTESYVFVTIHVNLVRDALGRANKQSTVPSFIIYMVGQERVPNLKKKKIPSLCRLKVKSGFDAQGARQYGSVFNNCKNVSNFFFFVVV